jgi:23S rRNA-/tRNA-specific pseudouridylate synthase
MKLSVADLRVLYRDEHLLVLDKPVGIATTAPAGGSSLFALAKELDRRAPQLHPLSRLDTQVTGIVAFARTAAVNHAALEARRAGRFERRYLGVTAHMPSAPSGRFTWSIGIHPNDPKKRVALEPDAPGLGVKAASTRYAVRASSGVLHALDLWPETGRTHQLRVHLSQAGSPLLGDVAYGGEKRLTLANGRIITGGRVMLHCASLRIPKLAPSGRALELDLVAPDDMRAVWRSAGGDDLALLGVAAP